MNTRTQWVRFSYSSMHACMLTSALTEEAKLRWAVVTGTYRRHLCARDRIGTGCLPVMLQWCCVMAECECALCVSIAPLEQWSLSQRGNQMGVGGACLRARGNPSQNMHARCSLTLSITSSIWSGGAASAAMARSGTQRHPSLRRGRSIAQVRTLPINATLGGASLTTRMCSSALARSGTSRRGAAPAIHPRRVLGRTLKVTAGSGRRCHLFRGTRRCVHAQAQTQLEGVVKRRCSTQMIVKISQMLETFNNHHFPTFFKVCRRRQP